VLRERRERETALIANLHRIAPAEIVMRYEQWVRLE
jgi:hypothetical protein